MTFLNVLNRVLRRLREEEVTTVTETTYSKMVSDFVNDAKTIVENGWDWSALRTTITVNTDDGVRLYSLPDSQNRIKVLNATNTTSKAILEYRTTRWFDEAYLHGTAPSASPYYYTFDGVDSNGDTRVDLYPLPDGDYDIEFEVVLRREELVNDTDQLLIPWEPVVHLAVALLARERGETGGTSAAEYFSIADKFMSDSIALDAQKNPEETIWYTP